MNRILILLAAIALASCGSDLNTDPRTTYEDMVSYWQDHAVDSFILIKGDNVNIREEPSVKSGLVAIKDIDNKPTKFQLFNGDFCKVLKTGPAEKIGDDQCKWKQIDYHDIRGWVYGRFTSDLLFDFSVDEDNSEGNYDAVLVDPDLEGGDAVSERLSFESIKGKLTVRKTVFIEGQEDEKDTLSQPHISGFEFTSSTAGYNGIFVKSKYLVNFQRYRGIIVKGRFYVKE